MEGRIIRSGSYPAIAGITIKWHERRKWPQKAVSIVVHFVRPLIAMKVSSEGNAQPQLHLTGLIARKVSGAMQTVNLPCQGLGPTRPEVNKSLGR